jgi:MFS family permease
MISDRQFPKTAEGCRHLQSARLPVDDRIPWAAMAVIIATVTVFALAQGLTYPLLSFILERQGTASGLIGLSAAMTPLGFVVSAPFIPALARRISGARLAILCSVLAATALAAIAWTQDIWAWMPLRFLLGFFANPLYVISETWLMSITPAPRRARIMGLYSSIVSGGFAIGPLSLRLFGTEGWPPFMAGIVAFLLCGLIVLAVAPRLPDMPRDGQATSVGGFFALAPLLLFAVFTAAAFEQILLSLFAAYGAALGSTEEHIASLITCFIAGNAVLQILLGRVAEKVGSARAMLICALASLAGCLALPLTFGSWFVWPLVFGLGGVSFGIYTLSLIQLGERFMGQALIAGNATFALVWGIGGIVGSPATGFAMQMIGHQGLPLSLGLLCSVLVALLTVKKWQGEAPKLLKEQTTALQLLQRLGTCATQWKIRASGRADTDYFSEGQLLELGITRVIRRARWSDGCETQLPMDYFEYRIHPDASSGGDR